MTDLMPTRTRTLRRPGVGGCLPYTGVARCRLDSFNLADGGVADEAHDFFGPDRAFFVRARNGDVAEIREVP